MTPQQRELIEAVVEWVNAGPHQSDIIKRRTTSIPVNYLIDMPEEAKVWIREGINNHGKSISTIEELNAYNPVGDRKRLLLEELEKLG